MSCSIMSNCWGYEDRCWRCRFSGIDFGENCYDPIDKNVKHPQIELEKKQRKESKKLERRQAKEAIDKSRKAIVKNAAKREEAVHKTLNSGRINKDADFSTDELSLDLKTQSTRINPVISVDEFNKLQNDANRAGKRHGVLIVENSLGNRFYVMSEELFKTKFI